MTKWFSATGPGAPKPGEVWIIYIGYPNAIASNDGGWSRGFPGSINIAWS